VSETNGERRARAQRAPRVVHLPSPRRLLRPEPALVLAGLALVGAMNAPVGVGTNDGGGSDPASTTQVTVAPGADSLRWFDQAERRERGDRIRAMYAVPSPSAAGTSATVGPVGAVSFRVPDALWAAYTAAADAVPASCNLDPRLLAAIGQVESGSLAGRGLDAGNRAVPAVFGPVLDGRQFATIRDTDHGRWDGDVTWDRAVGPMQFIPSTWARYGRDADRDGVADPQDIEDAALSAAGYLCAGGRDLAQPGDLRAAILAYNHSTSYLATVLALLPGMVPGGALGGSDVQALISGPPAPAAAPPSAAGTASPSGVAPASTASSDTTSPTTAPGTTDSPASPSPTTSATATSSTASSTTASPTVTSTTSTTTSTTTTSTTTTSTTTSTPSTTTTTPAQCGTTTATGTAPSTGTAPPTGTTSATTSPTTTGTASPTGDADPTPTGSCTSSPSATTSTSPTATPSTSSATATEAAMLDGRSAPTAD
jgi:Transglycosylase SLT domain